MEYIKFFENSDSRETYENGSDYTEPYVSYTPVINGYEAQLDGETTDDFVVTKQGNSYLISSNSNSIEIINEEFEEPPIVNSNVFYISNVSVIDNGTKKTRAHIYVFPEDLELTEESTEFTFNGVTYTIESTGTDTWSVIGRNPDEGLLHFSNMSKFDIISVPSSTSTDFVHYNRITPERITAKFIVVNDYAAKGLATLSRKITENSRLFDQIYINGTPIFDQPEEEIPTRFVGPTDYSVYHTFEEEGTYDIEYILKEGYVGTIPEGVFPPLQYFSEIIIPKGVTTIKTGAFSLISNYPYSNPTINVIIPNTITLVEDNAVYCSSLNSSTIQKFISINPDSVSIGNCEAN